MFSISKKFKDELKLTNMALNEFFKQKDFFKWAIPGLFYRLFLVFSNKHYNFYNNICEKCPSSIRCRDWNPRPLGIESPPVTTRPGLPTTANTFYRSYLDVLKLLSKILLNRPHSVDSVNILPRYEEGLL